MHKIPISITNNYGFIFDPEDYLNVRFNYRICGNLIGALVDHPRNPNFKGLPAILNQYEIKLLVDKNICELKTKNGLTLSPSVDDVKTFKNLQDIQLHEQIDLALSKRKEKMLKYLPNIISGKRKKLLKQGVKEEDIKLSPEIIIEEEILKIKSEVQESFVQIPCEHQLEVQNTSDSFKINPKNEFKHKVFEDLWTKSKGYITLGDSFGCDFLLYPGDPLCFHASHTIHVMGKNTEVEPFALIRTCRLSVIVNKFNLYAFESMSGEIEYQTIEWEGNVWRNETI